MNHHFSEVIKIVMKTLHVDRREFADLLGVNHETVRRWMSGEYSLGYRKKMFYLEQFKQLIREGNRGC